MRLTEAQRRNLNRAKVGTLSDGSGRGVAIEDGIELRVFERLASMGLVVMASANLYARITPAGRAALSRDGRGDG